MINLVREHGSLSKLWGSFFHKSFGTQELLYLITSKVCLTQCFISDSDQ